MLYQNFGYPHYPNGIWLDLKKPDSPIRSSASDSWNDEMGLSRNLSKIYIGNGQADASNFNNFLLDSNVLQFCDQNSERFNIYDVRRKGLSDYMGFHSLVSRNAFGYDGEMSTALVGLQKDYTEGSLLDSRMSPRCVDSLFREQKSKLGQKGAHMPNLSTSLSRLSIASSLFSAQPDLINLNKEREVLNLPVLLSGLTESLI